MPTVLWSALLPDVLIDMVGVSDPLAEMHIKQAAIEFCERSWVWIVDQGPIAIAPNQSTYQWEPPANTDPARPMQVWLNKLPLTAKSAGELSEIYGDFMQAEGSPQFFVQDRPDELIVVPRPTNTPAIGLTAKLAIKPKQTATGMEAVIVNEFRDAIVHGAKSRLLRVPKKQWTDAALSEHYRGMFDAAVTRAQGKAIRGYAGARQRVKPGFF